MNNQLISTMGSLKDNGGARAGAGRKPKAEELKMIELGEHAIIEVYGSIEAYWKHIAKESKDSLQHLKLIQEYVYGKPKERKDITTNGNDINISPIEWVE